MITRIYCVRHAEAMGNVMEFFQGRTDTDISPKGEKQLACLAERFKDIDFDIIYSSPLKRTRATAAAVNKYHSADILIDDRLIEINGGVWEGLKWVDIPVLYPEEHKLWTDKMEDFHIKDGEAMTEVYDRMSRAVDDIAAKNPGKTIVVVSHGCALRNYLCYANGDSIDKLADVGWSDNTAVSCVEYDENGQKRLIFKNDSSHLSEELSTLRTSKWCRYEDKKD